MVILQVYILDLSRNEITQYQDPRLFQQMTSIDLSGNKITQAEFKANLRNLEFIDLSKNHISNVRDVQVGRLSNLRSLRLSENVKLNSLSRLSSSSLEVLDLNHCFIRFFEPNVLDDLPMIKNLDISYNSFRKIVNLRSNTLEELDVSGGNLRYLTLDQLWYLPSLRKLNVSFNKNLELYFENKTYCLNLTQLDASNSELVDVNTFQLCNLELLNLAVNHLHTIQETTFFNNMDLVAVNLSRNDLSSIHKNSFFNTEKIAVLDLSSNSINDVSFTLYLNNVQHLNLSKNQLKGFVNMKLENVLDLDMSHNYIYTIDVDFNQRMPKLQRLDLSFNLLEILTRVTSDSLHHLDLSYCQIISIQRDAFSRATELRRINLIGNKLVSLDYKLLLSNQKLESLLLGHNPWICQCDSDSFKSLYTYVLVNKSLANGHELHCFQQLNKSWLNVCTSEWAKQNLSLTSRKTFYSLLTTFVMALLVIGVIIFCKYVRDQKRTDEATSEVLREMHTSRDLIDRMSYQHDRYVCIV